MIALTTMKLLPGCCNSLTAVEAVISPNGNRIIVHVEREFLVEVIGETKVCVKVNPEGCKDEDEEWGMDVDDEEFEELNPDFLVGSEEE